MLRTDPQEILAELARMRALDAPTHGGRVLSYVYDSGIGELDELATEAMRLVQPVNGLDPFAFPSVAAMERDLVGFARRMLHGDDETTGTVTSGGTESCLLAVKTARDVWRASHPSGRARLVTPVTAHAAFQKAAQYFDLALDLVPVDAEGRVAAAEVIDRLDDDVALVVVSAPQYPLASLDPVAEVAEAADVRGIACHVDACIGGFVLPWVEGVPAWDFAVPGVTSVSADLHKYGYAPKGASVLLQRGRDRQRRQHFATTRWPGYPVVNPTMLGSKSAGALAASWAIVRALEEEGFARLTATTLEATRALIEAIGRTEGLRVVGEPVGSLFAVAADESVELSRRVDPHHWADAARARGFLLQQQPGLRQGNGVRIPHTTHFTVTPVTATVLDEMVPALAAAAEEVRGVPAVSADQALGALPGDVVAGLAAPDAALDSRTAAHLLEAVGLGGEGGRLPERMAGFMALIEALPPAITERLLVELLARLVEPSAE